MAEVQQVILYRIGPNDGTDTPAYSVATDNETVEVQAAPDTPEEALTGMRDNFESKLETALDLDVDPLEIMLDNLYFFQSEVQTYPSFDEARAAATAALSATTPPTPEAPANAESEPQQ